MKTLLLLFWASAASAQVIDFPPVVASSIAANQGQWTQAGSAVKYTQGAVGIGTNPGAMLHLNSTDTATAYASIFSGASGSLGSPIFLFASQASNKAPVLAFSTGTAQDASQVLGRIKVSVSGSHEYFQLGDVNGNNVISSYLDTNQLGVNNLTPAYTLDVTGAIASTAAVVTGDSHLGTATGTQLFYCSGGTLSQLVIRGNSGAEATACTTGGGTVTSLNIFVQ